MTYEKKTIDYQINLNALREMETFVPMTSYERSRVRCWVKQGHELESNPWNYRDTDGYPLNYLQAFRLRNGYSSGPWDHWKGPDTQTLWDEDTKSFHYFDE